MKKIKYIVLMIALIVSTGLKSEEIQKVIIDDMYLDHVTATADGGYLSLSLLLDKNAEYSILTKHDANGRILWKKNLGDDVVWDFVELKDGSLVFVGKRYRTLTDGGVIYFKLSPCGEFLWGKEILCEDNIQIQPAQAIVNTDDGLLISSIKFANNIPKSWMEFFKIDYDGELLWSKILEPQKGITNHSMLRYNVDKDNNIIFSGFGITVCPWDDYYQSPGAYFIKIDKDANLLWEAMSGYDFDLYGICWSPPIIDRDNTVYGCVRMGFKSISGTDNTRDVNALLVFDTKKNTSDCYEINEKTSSNGYVDEWKRKIGCLNWIDDNEHIVTNISFGEENRNGRYDSDESVVKSYNMSFGQIKNYGMKTSRSPQSGTVTNQLVIINKQGDIIHHRNLENLDAPSGDMFITKNNEILAFNYSYKLNETHVMRFTNELKDAKEDTETYNYDSFCDHEIKSGNVELSFDIINAPTAVNTAVDTEKAIRVYPNPATGSVKLYLSRGLGEKTVDFYDATGRLCKSSTIGEGWAQENVDISELPTGVYFIKLTVDNKVVGNEKLIVK